MTEFQEKDNVIITHPSSDGAVRAGTTGIIVAPSKKVSYKGHTLDVVTVRLSDERVFMLSEDGVRKLNGTLPVFIYDCERQTLVRRNLFKGEYMFPSKASAMQFITQEAGQRTGKYILEIRDIHGVSLGFRMWHCDDRRYFLRYMDNGQLRGSYAGFGYYCTDSISDARGYADELAWKTGSTIQIEDQGGRILGKVGMPPGTPEGGILMHDMNTWGSYSEDDDD